MKKTLAILSLVPALAFAAGPSTRLVPLVIGTNGTASATVTDVRGYVEEIAVVVPTGSPTGSVSVTAQSNISSLAALALATNAAVTANMLVRPVVDSTDATGGALTSDPPRRPLLWGESVLVSISAAAPTGATWRVVIKTNEEN
jgi:hypothetical protein